METIKKFFRSLGWKSKEKPVYRVVTETIHDEVRLEVIKYYWIEKKNTVNWYQVGPKFTSFDECVKYYTNYREYVKNKELSYEYINEKK